MVEHDLPKVETRVRFPLSAPNNDYMKRYTVGFVFDKGLQNVLLVGKTHPEWQKGKYNGPGGKIEEGESDLQCMVREIKEEADLSIPESKWKEVAMMQVGDDVEVAFFTTEYEGEKGDVVSMTEEKLEWFPADKLPTNVISNVRWLVPLCECVLGMQDTPGSGISSVRVTYK